MTGPRVIAAPAVVAEFDRYHAEVCETLDDLAAAARNLVDTHGEVSGLALTTAYLVDKYGSVQVLSAMLAIALYRASQQHPAGG